MQNQDVQNLIARLQNNGVEVEPMVVKEDQRFECTAAELRAVANQNLSHPNSDVFLQAVAGLPDDLQVAVDRVDLEAVLSNRQVRIDKTQSVQTIGGRQKLVTTETKVLE